MTLGFDEALALHRDSDVIDLHADTPKLMVATGFDISAAHDRPLPGFANYLGHVDVPRMKAGGMSAQFFGLWTFPYPQSGCAASVDRQLDALDRAILDSGDALVWARAAEDVRASRARGAISALCGIEGGHALEGKIELVEHFWRRGVRYLGLLHFTPNAIGWPANPVGPRFLKGRKATGSDRGLSDFGRDVIAEMQRLGMIVDLAHINRAGFFDVLEATRDPVFVTHTGVRGVHEHWRNIDDEQLRAVAQNGGCVGIIFAKNYLGGASIDAVVDHILHVIAVAGIDTPALGSDFDGFVVPPGGLEDVSKLPLLTQKLSERGLDQESLRKLLGQNVMRVLDAVPPRQKITV